MFVVVFVVCSCRGNQNSLERGDRTRLKYGGGRCGERRLFGVRGRRERGEVAGPEVASVLTALSLAIEIQ